MNPSQILIGNYCFEVRGDASVQGEELAVDQTRDGDQVEGIHQEVVDLLVVLVEALLPKVEEGGHLPALVVAPQEIDGVGVANLNLFTVFKGKS